MYNDEQAALDMAHEGGMLYSHHGVAEDHAVFDPWYARHGMSAARLSDEADAWVAAFGGVAL